MKHKVEAGERMTFAQEDYAAGRLQWQKTQALEAAKVRKYLIAHPGANTVEIKAGTGIVKVSAALEWLRKRGFIKNTMSGPEVIPL